MKLVRGRLAAVSVRASFGAGTWVGITLGLVAGSVVGALLAWSAGTILSWQVDLAFTLGVARTLLPLGDQVGALRWISNSWYLVIPVVAVLFAAVAGLIGGLIGALMAAAYNRSPRHAAVVVELPDSVDEPTAGGVVDATSRPLRDGIRRGRGGDRGGSPRTPRSGG